MKACRPYGSLTREVVDACAAGKIDDELRRNVTFTAAGGYSGAL